jgi:hypothetical protein
VSASETTAAERAFLERTAQYLELAKQASADVPALKETDTPEQIAVRERLRAEAIQRARVGAKAGDLFGTAAPLVRATVQRDWRRRTAEERAGLLAEIPASAPPAVNSVYPTTYPLLTFPPTLLRALPALPEGLEYRLLGAHLVVRDIDANLIVDVLPNVLSGASNRGASR